MATTVRTKTAKKQQAFAAFPERSKHLEQAVMELEDAVMGVLASDRLDGFQDVDFLYWSRRLKNIATPLSLALGEHEGNARFHYHFRHEPEDYDTLYPVAGPQPVETLARVCREALTCCVEMVGVQDRMILEQRDRLEQAVRGFLRAWQASKR